MSGTRGHARFTLDGCGYDPATGQTLPRGTNVIFHVVMWNVSRRWARAIAARHGVRLVWESVS